MSKATNVARRIKRPEEIAKSRREHPLYSDAEQREQDRAIFRAVGRRLKDMPIKP